MSVNYNAKKKPELEALLKERGLTHSGNKPDLVQRLQEDDAEKSAAPQSDAAPAPQGDDIDWDDGDAAAPATETIPVVPAQAETPAPAAAAAEPVAAPSQVIDQAEALDTVEEPKEEPPTEFGASEAKPSAKEIAEATEAKKKAWEEKVGGKVAVTTAKEEAAKRKARLLKFGAIPAEPAPAADEPLTEEQKAEKEKKEARAKKFGTAAAETKETSVDANERIQMALGRALPERPERSERKRGRDRGDVGRGGVNKRVDSRRRDNREKPRGPRNGPSRPAMSDADRKAKEARAKRFSAPPV